LEIRQPVLSEDVHTLCEGLAYCEYYSSFISLCILVLKISTKDVHTASARWEDNIQATLEEITHGQSSSGSGHGKMTGSCE
jgi:hypothetical protein